MPVVAVVDAGGELLHLWRPDDAQVASVGVPVDKARTAASYRRPSKDFEEQAAGGRPSALHLVDPVPLHGGIPLVHDGHVIGAVGVSGATSADEDQELAVLGAGVLDVDEPVVHVRSADVFSPGGILVRSPGYGSTVGGARVRVTWRCTLDGRRHARGRWHRHRADRGRGRARHRPR